MDCIKCLTHIQGDSGGKINILGGNIIGVRKKIIGHDRGTAV